MKLTSSELVDAINDRTYLPDHPDGLIPLLRRNKKMIFRAYPAQIKELAQMNYAEGVVTRSKGGRLKCVILTVKTGVAMCRLLPRRQESPERWYESTITKEQSRIAAERFRLAANAPGSHTEEEWAAILGKFHSRCLRCGIPGDDSGPGKLTKDHITPLAMGGSHYASNLQPLCRSCNSWKGNRDIDFRLSVEASRVA